MIWFNIVFIMNYPVKAFFHANYWIHPDILCCCLFYSVFFPEYQYHLGRGHIGASMKTKLYHLLEQRSSTWYLFINFELLVAHFSSTSEFSDVILFIL